MESGETQRTQNASEIPTITTLCNGCAALDLSLLLLKQGKYAGDLDEDKSHYIAVGEILSNRTKKECDLCEHALRTMTSMAGKLPDFAGMPPLATVKDALIGIQVRNDLRNQILPCRALEISLGRYMGKSLNCELLPACADAGALCGTQDSTTIARIPRADVIDPSIVGEWIRTCKEQHGSACQPNSERRFDFDLWAIDVVDMKLSKLSSEAEYLALSYVWGQTPASVTTRDNLEARSNSPGSLRDVIEISSRVVRDAVELAKGVGVRYLWIDQLCVVRGEEGDGSDLLERTLRAMGDIYHHAAATIVAADGADANAGLVGVRAGSRELEQHLIFLGSGKERFGLMKMPRTIYLDDTTYMTRAWT